MIEIPEAITIAKQINDSIRGKKIINVIADYSKHKFAWYHGDPQKYNEYLQGKTIGVATAYGGMVQIKADSATILVGDGVGLRYRIQDQKIPHKHQLLLELDDYTKVSASVQMYGGIWCFLDEQEFKNIYYKLAQEKPSPLSDRFDLNYFNKLISVSGINKLSVKAFLATEQRIPGLGNGVLQDILWSAQINPKSKLNSLSDDQIATLFKTMKTVIAKMTELRGRDTEKDFFGNIGGYRTIMSKNSVGSSCIRCSSIIKKENYLGGSIYYCEQCQLI